MTARGITRSYGQGASAVHALRGVSLELEREKLTAVMGPSGSGKSTLMHILAGLDHPTEGEVWIDGTNITELDDDQLTKLRRSHIGFVFQFFNLLPMLSAEDNILLPQSIAGVKPDRAWMAELISKVGLGDRLAHRPSEMSGGQQQRVAVARALASRPDDHVRRRADGQPRLDDQRRDPRAASPFRGFVRADHPDGHPRRHGRGGR